MTNVIKNINVFVVYAPEDEPLKEKLVEHLSILRHQGLISVFDEGNIHANEDWQQRKTELLNKAHLILLLISSDLLASDNLYNHEVVNSLQRHNKAETCVVPILLRDCIWKTSIFANLKSLPKNGYAITDTQHWHSIDAAFKDVALGISKLVNNFVEQPNGSYQFQETTYLPISENSVTIDTLSVPNNYSNDYSNSSSNNHNTQQNKNAYYWFAALALSIMLLVVIGLIYSKKDKPKTQTPPIITPSTNPNTTPQNPLPLEAVQGLWLSANRQETFIAKMYFKGEFVEVFSSANNKNLSWGIEKVTVENNRKLAVNYKDWGIQFSINVEDSSTPTQVDSITFIYRSDTIKSLPIPLLNIVLIRPILAQQQEQKENPPNNLIRPTPDIEPNKSTSQDTSYKTISIEPMPADTNTISLRQLNISPAVLIRATPTTKPNINNRTTLNPKITPQTKHTTTNQPNSEPEPLKINADAVQKYINPKLKTTTYHPPDTSISFTKRTSRININQ